MKINKTINFWIVLFGLFFCFNARSEFMGEIGNQWFYSTDREHSSRQLFYWQPSHEQKLEDSNISTHASIRLQIDEADSDLEVLEIKALNIKKYNERTKWTLGWQEIAWGETFGVYVLDIVNPRDLRDPLFTDIGWNRLSVPAVNYSGEAENLSWQLVWVPLSRSPIYPDLNSDFNPYKERFKNAEVREAEEHSSVADSEYGGRINYLTTSGLDMGVYYYNHWPRNLVYEIITYFPKLVIRPVQNNKVNSYGLSFSYPLEDWVLRGDLLLNDKDPIRSTRDLSGYEVTERSQAVVGTDYNLGGTWSLGLQLHYENDSINDAVSALSTRVAYKIFESLEGEIFLYKDLNEEDLWLAPQVTLQLSDQSSWILRGDFLTSKSGEGRFSYWSTQSRVISWLKYVW